MSEELPYKDRIREDILSLKFFDISKKKLYKVKITV